LDPIISARRSSFQSISNSPDPVVAAHRDAVAFLANISIALIFVAQNPHNLQKLQNGHAMPLRLRALPAQLGGLRYGRLGEAIASLKVRLEGGSVRRLRRESDRPPHFLIGPFLPGPP
jgi:hypothetical protein